jgi:pyrimidine-specific ribonucleoside hydrolase
MDIVLQSAIPLHFFAIWPSSFILLHTFLASLDQNEEADKWLFDIVQY